MIYAATLQNRTLLRLLPSINVIVVVVSSWFGVMNIAAGHLWLGGIQLAGAAANGVSLGLLLASRGRWSVKSDVARVITLVSIIVVGGVLAAAARRVPAVELFVFVIPPVLLLVGRRRFAAIMNVLFFGVVFAWVVLPRMGGPTRDYYVAFGISYAVLTGYIFLIAGLRDRSVERIRYLATHDVTTDLPRFETSGERIFPTAYAVLIQLRHSDRVRLQGGNRLLRHVLRTTAERLAPLVAADDHLLSYSGTGLLMLSSEVDESERHRWLTAAQREVSRPVAAGELSHTPHVVFYVVPETRGLSGEELERRLETTVQADRPASRRVVYYDEVLDHAWRTRMELFSDLRYALEREELRAVYQPLVDAIDGGVVGAEVLMRWDSPRLGAVPPSTFIPVAEESGLIGPMTEWLIAHAWRQSCNRAAPRFRELSINISPAHLQQPDFLSRLMDLVAREGIDPAAINVEITEGILLQDTEDTMNVLQNLVAAGFRLSIDDFGTGYSNFSYLRRLDAHRIKIDRSFVADLVGADGNADARAVPLVEAMVFVAKTLGITTLAEGVELPKQAQILRDLGCETFQGYLFGKPEPIPTPGTTE